MFQGGVGPGQGPRARALCLRRPAPACRAHGTGDKSNASSSNNKINNDGRTSRLRSNALASSSGTGGGGTTLILQGALGVGIGLGLGLGFGVGVSNMLQLGDSEEMLSSSPSSQDLLARPDKLDEDLARIQNKGKAFLAKLKSHAAKRKATDVLIQLNCLTFFLQKASKGWLSAWGCKHNAAIASGQVWRLATPALLHGNLVHLLLNLWSLNVVGPTTENLFGRRRMLAVYVAAGVTGNVCSYYMNPLPALGCSGAIFGLLGGLGAFYWTHRGVLRKEHRRPLRSIVRIVLANAVFGVMTPNIDSAAHLGGLCAGAAAVLLLGPSFSVEDRKLVDKPLLPIFASKPLSLK